MMLLSDSHFDDPFGLEPKIILFFNISSDFGKDLFILDMCISESYSQVFKLDCLI